MSEKKSIEELLQDVPTKMTEEEKDEQLAGMMWGNLLEDEEVTVAQCRETVRRMRSK